MDLQKRNCGQLKSLQVLSYHGSNLRLNIILSPFRFWSAFFPSVRKAGVCVVINVTSSTISVLFENLQQWFLTFFVLLPLEYIDANQLRFPFLEKQQLQ